MMQRDRGMVLRRCQDGQTHLGRGPGPLSAVKGRLAFHNGRMEFVNDLASGHRGGRQHFKAALLVGKNLDA